MVRQPDVWFVTNSQAIEWIKKPTPLNKLNSFEPWKCRRKLQVQELTCTVPNMCKLYSRVFQQYRFFYTCSECPEKYPWIRNEYGFD